MPINCMRDVLDAVKNNDITTFKQEFADFYANDPTPLPSVNVKSRLVEILQDCAFFQHAEIFDFALTFCSEDEKDASALIWAAGNTHNIDHLLSEQTNVEHAQHALSVAIHSGRLEHVKKLLGPAQGRAGLLQPLWLAIYHKNIEIFDYLLTTPWLPQKNVKSWEQGWDDMLIAAATYNFPECVPQLLVHGADPKAKNSLALQFAGGREDHVIFDLLYPLSDLPEAIADMQTKLSNPAMGVSLNRIESKMAQDQKNSILETITDTNAQEKEPKKM